MTGGIQIVGLGKDFAGKPAIDDISFEVSDHELFVIVGESGCGKSTLLRLIAGLDTPDRGTIRLHDDLVADSQISVPPEQRGTGFVFQSYALWPHMSVQDNVAFPLEASGKSRKAAAQLVQGHLATVALQDLAQRKPEALSGGQRQRVALARCLAGGARTILMDEPLANLDPHLRHTMEQELLRFHRASGATTVYITHDQREAMALADRMAVMKAGRILQIGTPQEIYDHPNSTEVAQFIGHGAVVSATYETGFADIQGHRFHADAPADHPAGQVQVLIRPEAITLVDDQDQGGLEGVIESVLYRGGLWEAEVGFADSTRLVVTHRAPLRTGQTLRLRINRAWVLAQ